MAPGAGTAAAVGGGEGLMQVVMHHVNASVGGAHPAEVGVHVGAVHVEKRAGFVQDFGDLGDVALVDAAGIRVGDHERRGGFIYHVPQLFHGDAAVLVNADFDGPRSRPSWRSPGWFHAPTRAR